jgi:hypothetical protein
LDETVVTRLNARVPVENARVAPVCDAKKQRRDIYLRLNCNHRSEE